VLLPAREEEEEVRNARHAEPLLSPEPFPPPSFDCATVKCISSALLAPPQQQQQQQQQHILYNSH